MVERNALVKIFERFGGVLGHTYAVSIDITGIGAARLGTQALGLFQPWQRLGIVFGQTAQAAIGEITHLIGGIARP